MALLAVSGLCACSDSGPPTTGDADALDGDAATTPDAAAGEDVVDLLPGQICIPGTAKACVVEGGKQALICNASGTNWAEGICKGPDGRDSMCINSECTECFPGTQKCGDEETVLECASDGAAWEVYTKCMGGTSGQVCAIELTGEPCQSLCTINYKYNSYIGCDYWAVDLDNAFVPGGGRSYYDAAGAQYAIAVANPPGAPLPTTVEVSYKEGGVEKKVPYDVDGQPLPDAPLQPGDLRVYRLPSRNVEGTIQAPLAYRVTATAPIIAYQFNPLTNENVFSNDASLLLPATLLGREYYVMTREQTFDTLRSFLTVVAVLPGETTVSVQFSAPTMEGKIYPGSPTEEDIPHQEPGQTKIFHLEQFDVLNVETDRPGADLTGSIVLSDQRVAVFGGSEASNAPNTARCIDFDELTGEGVCEYNEKINCKTLMDCVNAGYNTCCADHLEQQLFPVKTWGTVYLATKSWDRGKEPDIWRIMASEDNTKIVLNPPLKDINVPVLNRGEWFEFESTQHFEIHSVVAEGSPRKPILVGQFLAAQDAPEPNVNGNAQADDAGTGDPAFMLAVPFEQYRTDFVIHTPAEYEDNYINITVPSGAAVTVDGEEIPSGYFEPIASGTYSVYRTRIQQWGPHTITSSEPAGVIVYGYDQYVSYAYTGGLDLAEINQENPFILDEGR